MKLFKKLFTCLLDFYNRILLLSIGGLYARSFYRDGKLIYAVIAMAVCFILAKVHFKKCYVYSVITQDGNNKVESRTVESFEDKEEVIEDLEMFEDDIHVKEIKVEREKMKLCLGRIFDY